MAAAPYIYKTKGPAVVLVIPGGVASYTRDVFDNTYVRGRVGLRVRVRLGFRVRVRVRVMVKVRV